MANLDFVNNEFVTRKDSCIRSCDTITVYYEIKEGEKLELSF
jgi:hypothetical protein